jgi:hypothetical protein
VLTITYFLLGVKAFNPFLAEIKTKYAVALGLFKAEGNNGSMRPVS